MARHIDADKLLKDVKDATPMNWTNSEAEIQAQLDWKCFIALIKGQPTADVAEVKWIDVSERLPEKEGDYLCVMSDDYINPFVIIKRFVNGRFYVTKWYEENVGRKVTHWMPLPEPPSGAKMDGGKEE